jgi:glycosyltransferase involved in cell wall biosynthesis
MSPFFSVIIPAYNVGAYIGQCVDSVLAQTFKNLEVIIIDNASTDETSSICDNYTETERERVRVVHLVKNVGPAGARNRGLELAKGAYILLLDSDDWLTDGNFLTDAHELIASTRAEVIFFGNAAYSDRKQRVIKAHDIPFLGEEAQRTERVVPDLVRDGKISHFVYNRLVARSLVDAEKGETFNEGLIAGEDFEWSFRILMKCKTVASLGKSPLTCRVRDNSTSALPITISSWMSNYNALRLCADHAERRDVDPNLRDAFCRQLTRLYYLNLGQIPQLSDKMDRKQAYGLIKEYDYLGQLACDRKTRLLKCVSMVFGSRIAAYVMRRYRDYCKAR